MILLQKADLGGALRGWAVGFSIGSYGYIGTGNYASYLSDFWRYDPSTDDWTEVASLPSGGRWLSTAFSVGGKAYLVNGHDNVTRSKNDIWEYDPSAVTVVREMSNSISSSIFPNPFSFETILRTKDSMQESTLTIYNSLGVEVKKIDNITGQEIVIQRAGLPAGLYLIYLKEGDKIRAVEKLVISDN